MRGSGAVDKLWIKSLPNVYLRHASNGRNCQWGMLSYYYKQVRVSLRNQQINLTQKKGNSMNELALENITTTKCVECGDKLTSWETSGYCIICEPDTFEEFENGEW